MKTFEAVTLHDEASNTRARIVPALGFNCYSFEAVVDGQPCELLWSAADLLLGTQKPSRSGIPILFPFAGRIRGTAFEFENDRYSLPVGDDFGNAIHGFVFNRPWRILEARPNRAVGEFQASIDDPSLLSHWPADFCIRASYRVAPNALRIDFEINNPDNRALPFWFGTHPYFRLPLVAGGDARACRITVPAARYWELADLLPTGKVLEVTDHRDLRDGMPFDDWKIDDILSELEFAGDRCQARIEDPAAARSMTITFGREFNDCVVFTPPHREAVCIEPYTSVSNAFELEAKGIKTGMKLLAAGETFRAWIEIALT